MTSSATSSAWQKADSVMRCDPEICSKKTSIGMRFLVLALLLAFTGETCSGATFRLSFLDGGSTLADTCELLRQAGISQDSVSTFRKQVEYHNLKGNRVDKTEFPPAKNGFHEFHDLADFTNRLRTVLFLTPPSDHSPSLTTFTCFDVVCLLLHGAGCGAADFERHLDTRSIVVSKADREVFRSEYSSWALIPEWYYEHLAGKTRSEGETQLILSLRANRRLAPEATNDLAWRAAFTSYVQGIEEGGFVFPKHFKLGLGFYAAPQVGRFFPDHAFLCIPNHGRLVCVEKNRPAGPYVRAEFKSETDLAGYISWSMLEGLKKDKEQPPIAAALVSLNDKLIGVYPSGDLK